MATWAVNKALSVSGRMVGLLAGDMEMCFLPTISHSLMPSFLSWVGKQVTIDRVPAQTRRDYSDPRIGEIAL